ncbi:uncharacterized protein LOC120768698 [Bactrocera tryoni]|uniref:uncharacterized protein LOC120768698 n=1 Tax=Bactrocera tryoni TaxID=59916 RepID=UPI001A972BF9|nr:uncharacterized protein LOC120768698 [Bactrocera tryoni]
MNTPQQQKEQQNKYGQEEEYGTAFRRSSRVLRSPVLIATPKQTEKNGEKTAPKETPVTQAAPAKQRDGKSTPVVAKEGTQNSPKQEYITQMRRAEEESLEKCKGIVQKMKLAMAKQKNVCMDVKNGTAQLDELFDVIKSYRRNWLTAENEKRRPHLSRRIATPESAASKRRATSPVEPRETKERGTWLEDSSSTAAIWLPPGSNATTVSSGNGTGFVWAKCEIFTVISCYLTPSDNTQEFQEKLDNIEDTARTIEGQLIIARDLNARAVEWGMPNTDSRGKIILEMTARLGLIVLNTGNATMFRRRGCEETTPDITLSTERMAGSINNWKVLEDYTGSDHHYISFMIDTGRNAHQLSKNSRTRKWNISKLDTSKLVAAIDEQNQSSDPSLIARKTVEHTMLNITKACQKSMPKVTHSKRKAAVYWWTENIAKHRRTCLRHADLIRDPGAEEPHPKKPSNTKQQKRS